jgi:putative ABC transport system substrate-binding protein
MRRREFITIVAGAASTWPLTTRAQQSALPIIGYLSSGTPAGFAPLVDAFRQGLKESGFVEARNVAIEFRWSEGRDERLPAQVTELIRQHATVIVATGGSAPAVAAKAATATLPIVFTGGQDPVKLGLVESLGRPAGNATGVLNIAPALTSKRLELLRELAAKPELIAVLKTTGMGSDDQVADLESAAAKIRQKIEIFNVNGESEFDESFAAIARARAGALYVLADPFFTSRATRLIALAGQYTLPACYSFRSFTVVGGLMSYGANLPDQHRQAGIYTGRILKGERPADLPVLQPTKFELVINLKTAKALGITIPQTLLTTADEVIE